MTGFGIDEIAAPPAITGFVGLVVEPDAATIRKAYELASRVIPVDAPMALGPGLLPHVTLTQCALREAPRERLAAFAGRLDATLRDRGIPLSAVSSVAGGFVFWCVDPASPEHALLRMAHEDALPVANGFLDPVANAAVVEGTARLTNDDTQLVENARTFGYAFIRDRYLPHITLGFDPRLAPPSVPDRREPHAMIAARVVLVRFGPHGRATQILAL